MSAAQMEGMFVPELPTRQFIAKNNPIHSAFFSFLANIAQSTVGFWQGSNACTIIAVKFGDYCKQKNLDISLLWNQLPNVWVDSFVNAVCDCNALYDELYGDTAVNPVVEGVVNDLEQECHVQSVNQMVGFTSAYEYPDLVDHINGAVHASTTTLMAVRNL